MAATKGNQFWKLRSRHGIRDLFEEPSKLQEAICEYFEWCDENPLLEDKIGWYEGTASHEVIEKMRAYTLSGLCVYLGIDPVTWHRWAQERDDLNNVIRWANGVIKTQKFTGAAANLLNPVIISRDLGLGDKSYVQNLDAHGQPIAPPSTTVNICLDGILDDALSAAKNVTEGNT